MLGSTSAHSSQPHHHKGKQPILSVSTVFDAFVQLWANGRALGTFEVG